MTNCSTCNNIKEDYQSNDNNIKEDNKHETDTKENFICAACIGAGFAAVGIGATTVGAKMKKQQYKRTKTITLWSGIISLIIAILLFIWAILPKKYGGCKACKSNF